MKTITMMLILMLLGMVGILLAAAMWGALTVRPPGDPIVIVMVAGILAVAALSAIFSKRVSIAVAIAGPTVFLFISSWLNIKDFGWYIIGWVIIVAGTFLLEFTLDQKGKI